MTMVVWIFERQKECNFVKNYCFDQRYSDLS